MSDSAFPEMSHSFKDREGDWQHVINEGLTKREFFAALAMQGLLAAVYSSKEMLNEFTTDGSGAYKKHVTGCKAISDNAVAYADALIEALAAKKALENK